MNHKDKAPHFKIHGSFQYGQMPNLFRRMTVLDPVVMLMETEYAIVECKNALSRVAAHYVRLIEHQRRLKKCVKRQGMN